MVLENAIHGETTGALKLLQTARSSDHAVSRLSVTGAHTSLDLETRATSLDGEADSIAENSARSVRAAATAAVGVARAVALGRADHAVEVSARGLEIAAADRTGAEALFGGESFELGDGFDEAATFAGPGAGERLRIELAWSSLGSSWTFNGELAIGAVAVPEPGPGLLLSFGLAGLPFGRRR